jgi:hypothetical protein
MFRFLFWSDTGKTPKIERSSLSGEQRTRIVKTGLLRPISMTVDYQDQRIFWVDASRDSVESSDYNGNGRKKVMGLPNTDFVSILIYKVSPLRI